MALVKDLLLSFLSGSFSYLVDRLVILSRLCSFLQGQRKKAKKIWSKQAIIALKCHLKNLHTIPNSCLIMLKIFY